MCWVGRGQCLARCRLGPESVSMAYSRCLFLLLWTFSYAPDLISVRPDMLFSGRIGAGRLLSFGNVPVPRLRHLLVLLSSCIYVCKRLDENGVAGAGTAALACALAGYSYRL